MYQSWLVISLRHGMVWTFRKNILFAVNVSSKTNLVTETSIVAADSNEKNTREQSWRYGSPDVVVE